MRKLLLIAALLAPFALPAQNNVQVYVTAEMGSSFAGGSIAAQQITPQGNGTPSLTFFFDASGNANGLNGMGLPGNGTWQFRFCQSTSNICYNAQIAFPGVPRFDATAIFTAAIISGGSGCTPGGVSGTVQVAGGGGTCAGGNINDAQTLPGAALVSESLSVLGPRPHVDVTAFGAKGNNTANDTLAIQSAINAACATSGIGGAIPAISFPPGVYLYTWPQVGSGATAAFTQPCPLRWEGLGQSFGGAQFPQNPAVWLVLSLGANPANVPFLDLGDPNNEGVNNGTGSSFYGITVEGYKKVFNMINTSQVAFAHTTGSTFALGTLANGDCPYTFSAAIFLDFDHAGFQTPAGGYGFCGIDTSSAQPVGEITISNGGSGNVGCVFYYNNNVNSATSGPGSININNVRTEVCNSDAISINNSNGFSLNSFANLEVDNVLGSDGSCGSGCGVVHFNIPGSTAEGITVRNSKNSSSLVSVLTTSGGLVDDDVTCGSAFCAGQVIDGNGNAAGSGMSVAGSGGKNFTGPGAQATITGWERTELTNQDGASPTPSTRWFKQGTPYSALGADAGIGHLYGTGAGFGYDAAVGESAQGVLNVYFAGTYPPTGVTSVAGGTGGSLAAGTYQWSVRSTYSSNCAVGASAPSVYPTALVINGTTNTEATISWSLPTAGTKTIVGYCVQRGNPLVPGTGGYYFVSGASTTSFLDTGAAFTSGGLLPFQNQQFVSSTFTPSGLTVPNLTITGTCTGCGISFGGTPGIIPVFTGSFPFLTNSSPQLDLTTHSLGLTFLGSGGVWVPNGGINAANYTLLGAAAGTFCTNFVNGVLTLATAACATGGTVLNSGAFVQGAPVIPTSVALTLKASPAYLDCSAFPAADWGLIAQACLSALNSLNSISGVADMRGVSNSTTASVNPEGGTMPASGTMLMGAGTYLTNVPFVDHGDWSVQGESARGVDGQVGTTIKAGASFQATYTTGTITVGAPGASEVITGSGTTWAASMIGCAFYGANGGANSTFGIVTAVGSTTSLTLGWGTNIGSGAAGGSSYTIACPVHAHGSGGASNAGAQFGMASTNMNYDCNNVAGCIGDLDWYGQQGTYDLNVGIHNSGNIGLDLENQFQQSGPWNGIVVSMGTSCTASSLPFVIHGNGQLFRGLINSSGGGGACATKPSIGIDVAENGTVLSNLDIASVGVGAMFGANTACPVACAVTGRLTNGWEVDNFYLEATGTTAIESSNAFGTNQGWQVSNISNSGTNSLIDLANSCTENNSRLARYVTYASGTINQSTSSVGGCQPSNPGTTTIASGTVALGTSSISSASCATVVTVTATGVATTDNIAADFNADPTSTVGYIPSASGMLTIIKYPTTNNVNFKVCNNTGGSVTPGAVTLNWRVTR